MFVYVDGQRSYLLNIVDHVTNYGERAVALVRKAETMVRMFCLVSMYQNEAPRSFSADSEFCKNVFEYFLEHIE